MVDLSSTSNPCSSLNLKAPPNFFTYSTGHVTATGDPVVCNNMFGCMKYDLVNDDWTEEMNMGTMRSLAASVQTGENQYWILGGLTSGIYSNSTEVYNALTDSFKPGPEMPLPVLGHCVVKVNATHIFVGM